MLRPVLMKFMVQFVLVTPRSIQYMQTACDECDDTANPVVVVVVVVVSCAMNDLPPSQAG